MLPGKPDMWHSSGTGRTEGRKLKRPAWPMPSQSARSRALASAVDSPIRRIFRSVWEEMKLVRDTITSSTCTHAHRELQSLFKDGRVEFKGTESRDFLLQVLFLWNLPPHLEPFLKVIFLSICYVLERTISIILQSCSNSFKRQCHESFTSGFSWIICSGLLIIQLASFQI